MLHRWIGIALGTCLLTTTVAAQGTGELEKPVRLEAGGVLIDAGAHIAHAGPLFGDYDGDGVPDLLVGNFSGHIQVYKNAGTKKAPEFEDKGLLQVDGKPVRIHNW
jgi:hypothetical protein